MNSRISLLLVWLLMCATVGLRAQDPVRSLQDLVGARGSTGEDQLRQRGYSFVRVDKAGGDAYSFWRENRSGRCVTVRTSDGRYQSIVYTPNADCNRSQGGGNWNGGRPGGDSGQYQILSARYGTENRNIDVTARLKQLARQDTRFRMGNSTFGTDPDPGRVKMLRIYARGPNGQERMFEYREGSTVDGSTFRGWGGGNWGDSGWNGGWHGSSGPGGGNGGGGGGDSGQYQILSARYGTENRNIDVTNRLKQLAQQDTTFRMGNSTFGTDPDPGRVKTLRIYARGPNGGERMFEYREGSTVDGSMFTGWRGGNWGDSGWNGGWNNGSDWNNGGGDSGQYRILAARYGTENRNIDVTARLKELARQDRTFRMGNSTFGTDPDPGRVKMLRIYTRGPNGQERMFEYREGSTVDGSMFTGWGRGDWGDNGWNGGWGR